jgi:hypothetical protein
VSTRISRSQAAIRARVIRDGELHLATRRPYDAEWYRWLTERGYFKELLQMRHFLQNGGADALLGRDTHE